MLHTPLTQPVLWGHFYRSLWAFPNDPPDLFNSSRRTCYNGASVIKYDSASINLTDTPSSLLNNNRSCSIVIRLEQEFDVSDIRTRGNPAEVYRRRTSVPNREGPRKECGKYIEDPITFIVPCAAKGTDTSFQSFILYLQLLRGSLPDDN